MNDNKISMTEPFGHILDIRVGSAVVPYNRHDKCWMAPGGGKVLLKGKAKELAERINAMISR